MTRATTAQLSVHFARTGDTDLDKAISPFERVASRSSNGHVVVNSAESADLVLLTQPHLCTDPLLLRKLRKSDAWLHHREKTFIIDFRDRPWCAFPGLYASMPSAPFSDRWQRAWMYPWIDEDRFRPLREAKPDLLFSFVGGRTHPCRDAILAMDTSIGAIEESIGFDFHRSPTEDERRGRFAELVSRSKFVLCPRGHGTSSFRLQEVLAAGRVPVIISDDWVEPIGPDWEAATVRCPEAKVQDLPSVLLELEPRQPTMSAEAERLYDTWFASDVMFDRVIEQLMTIKRETPFPSNGIRGRWYGRLALAPYVARARAIGKTAMQSINRRN